jgi:hypothetical protein
LVTLDCSKAQAVLRRHERRKPARDENAAMVCGGKILLDIIRQGILYFGGVITINVVDNKKPFAIGR